MSRWRFKTGHHKARRLVAGVDRQAAAWLPSPGQTPCEGSHPALAEAVAALQPRRVDLVAAPGLAVHWMQPVATGLGQLGELQQSAQARCAQLFGGQATDWRVTGDWRLDRPFICAALPTDPTWALEQTLSATGAQVQWHTAWGLLCAGAAPLFPGQGWSVLRSPRHLQIWACRRGLVHHVATLATRLHTTESALVDQAREHVLLECASQGESPPARLRWLDLCAADDPYSSDKPAREGMDCVTLSRPAFTAAPLQEAGTALVLAITLKGST